MMIPVSEGDDNIDDAAIADNDVVDDSQIR
jgi:hypothetical protein